MGVTRLLRSLRRTDVPGPLRAALWMCCAAIAFSVMITAVRYLSATQNTLEIAFFRNFFGLVVLLPWLWRNGLSVLRTEKWSLHLLRGGLAFITMIGWFTTLAHLPLAEATALSFLAPIFVSVLATFVLGEVMRARRWFAIAAALVGALVILRPGQGVVHPAAFLAVGTAVVWASGTIVLKVLSRTEPSTVIVAHMVILLTPISFVLAIPVWQTPTIVEWVVFVTLGAAGSIGHFCAARAMAATEAGLVATFDYMRLPFVAGFAFLIFGQTVDIWTWLGASIIIGSGSYIAFREARLHVATDTNAKSTGS